MSRTAPSNRRGSARTSSASFTDPAGPTTSAPRWLSSHFRSSASKYSSSTTRRQRPFNNSVGGLDIFVVLDVDHELTMHAVVLEFELRFRFQLVRQCALDQFATVTHPRGLFLGHLDSAFAPINDCLGFRILHDAPFYLKSALRLTESTIFERVGRQFVQSQSYSLNGTGRQDHWRALD